MIPLEDRDKFTVGNLEVTAFAVPGHTPGSAAHPSCRASRSRAIPRKSPQKQRLIGPNGLFSNDTSEGAASLKHLDRRVAATRR